ncbi:MAG TPA: hypothetical protein VGN14_14405 [Candidatus Elarobacter sp.]|jgi:hypothetical protein
MAANDNTQKSAHRSYRSLPVVVDYDEHPERVTVGVLVDGAFVPIAQHDKGAVEQMKTRWSELGGTAVEDDETVRSGALEQRVAALERAALAAGQTLDAPAPPPPPPASE